MYDDFSRNYSPYPTYANDYDDYFNYEDDYYNMNNDYDRFAVRQVNNAPYNSNRNTYIDTNNMYPEIYKKISPMIEKRLKTNNIINSEDLDKITFEVYDEIVKTDIGKKLNVQVSTINTGYTTSNDKQNTSSTSNGNKISNQGMNKYAPVSNMSVSSQSTSKETVKEVSNKPARSNCLLCDLIKILILDKLTGESRPPRPRPNPPYHQAPRPPRPGMPSNRPPYPGSNTFRQAGNVGPSYFDVPYPEDFMY